MAELDTADLVLFKEILQQYIGFVFPVGLESEFSYRLTKVLQEYNITMPQLLNQLRYVSTPAVAFDLLSPFLPQLLIGETYFWREPETFEALSSVILPELVRRKANYGHLLRVWSAACSSGEEVYSLAILLRHFFAATDSTDWLLSILGTDINEEALERARLGEYGEYSLRGSEKTPWLLNCFEQLPGLRPRWRIKNQYRTGVRFQSLNLASTNYPAVATDTCSYDLIFCRNVFIYFKPELSAQIIERLYNSLNDGGYLVVSPCEYFSQHLHNFEPVQVGSVTFYRRPTHFPTLAKPAATWNFPLPIPQTKLASWGIAGAANQPKVAQSRPTASARPTPVSTVVAPAPPDLVSLLKTALQTEQLSEAVRLGLQSCAAQPLNAECYLLLTIACQKAGQFAEAYAAARKAVYIESANLEALFYLANLHRQFDNPKRAVQTYRRLLDLATDSHPPFTPFLGLTLSQLRQAVQANLAQLEREEY